MNEFIQKKRSIIESLIVNVALLIFCLLFYYCKWRTNDDVLMKNIVSPKMDVKTILDGEMFNGIVHSIEKVSKSRINTEDIDDGLRLLSNHLRACFGIDTEISILDEDIDTMDDYQQLSLKKVTSEQVLQMIKK